MKFSCTQENLMRGLDMVSHIALKNVNLPILNNILIDLHGNEIKFSGTNLEIGISCIVRGKIEDEGKFTVGGKVFADLVSTLPNERVDLELKEDSTIKVVCKNSSVSLKGMSAEDYPLIPQIEKGEAIVIKSKDLKEGLLQVIFAAAADESKPEISGVLFNFQSGSLTLAGTDSYRLAEKVLKLANNSVVKNVIVPLKTCQELVRVIGDDLADIDMEIYLSETQILFKVDSIELISRVINGQYPDYRQIIPKNIQTKIKINTNALLKILKSAGLFCRPGINDISLKFSPSKKEIIIFASNTQVGEGVFQMEDIDMEGEESEIIFNHRYLFDGLNNLKSGEATLEISSSATPAILRDGVSAQDYLYIIMPIKK